MANKPFEYTIINPLERPTSTDINQLQAQAHYDVRLLAEQLFAGAEGFVGDSAKAVPLPVPSLGFSWTPGIMFTVGTAENNIGAISGLSDSYLYKATNIAYRPFNVTNAPTTSGYVRYDLLEVRALTGSERLTDSTSVGIFNPTLKSFPAAIQKYKTLTSSLGTDTDVEEVAYNVTGTAPLVYKSGQEIAYPGSWSLVPKPTVDPGYLAVAYIRRFEGQTEIIAGVIEDARDLLTVPSTTLATVPVIKGGTGQESLAVGEVLLGNGTSGITSTAILPVSKGGTGNSSTSAFTGSVAWFDSATDQIKYTQAQLGAPSFLPISGYLLASNASGEPTWIAPGTAGLPLVSTGSAWAPGKVATAGRSGVSASGTYNVSALALTGSFVEIAPVSTTGDFDIVGNLPYTISLLPCTDGITAGIMEGYATGIYATVTFTLKFTIMQGATVVRSWQFRYGAQAESAPRAYLPPITFTDMQLTDKTGCTFKLEAKEDGDSAFLNLINCYYLFAQ